MVGNFGNSQVESISGAQNGCNGHYGAKKVGDGENAVSELYTENYSELQVARQTFAPPVPATLKGCFKVVPKKCLGSTASSPHLAPYFPALSEKSAVELEKVPVSTPHAGRRLTVGIVLSGGQAPGGHNVIAGVYDHLQTQHPGSRLLGFLNGPRGIINSDIKDITADEMERFRNQGGFHMICSGRDKIESQGDLQKAAETVKKLNLDGLIVAGGDDSNTNAAVLAEYFLSQGLPTSVIGVPKTIDGDLKNSDVAVSFGFDTACKVYSELIGNIMMDAASAKKYWHWIRLMGRSASHITLECALQTHPQAALISEEVAAHKQGLAGITKYLADIVAARSANGQDYGIVLLPEGLIEFVPEVGTLIQEINEILAQGVEPDPTYVAPQLSPESFKVFHLLPAAFKQQLLLDRDPHGNVQVAKIETERLLLELVEVELADRKKAGRFAGKFSGLSHYMGYEGRASLPTNFDATYCYALGHAAGALLGAKQTGLMASLFNLQLPAEQWGVGGTPLPSMMAIERRKGKDKPVIRKALVDLQGAPFTAFAARRQQWAERDCFRSPGPIQFQGEGANSATITLALEINGGRPIAIV